MTSTLGHVNIVVSDMALVQDFFVTYLDMAAGAPTTVTDPWVSIITGLPNAKATFVPLASKDATVRIELLRYDEPLSPPMGFNTAQPNIMGYRHIGFDVADIDATTAKLQAAGYSFLSEPQSIPAMHTRTVYFEGPEAILLQLQQKI